MTGTRAAEREPAIFRSPRAALGAAALLVGVFIAVAIVVSGHHRLVIDDTWSRWMRDARTGPLVDVSKALAVFGGFVVQLVIRLAVAGVLVARSWWRRLGAWALVALLSSALGDLVKSLVGRARPAHGLVHANGSAFPSGHALAAAVTAIGIVLVFVPPGRTRLLGYGVAAAWVLVMAGSRTILGVHWLTDVVAGGALGAALTVGSFAFADLVADRGGAAEPVPSAVEHR